MRRNILWIILFLFRTFQQEESYKKFVINVQQFVHRTLRYPTNNCCWEERDQPQCSLCGIRAVLNYGTERLTLFRDDSKISHFVYNQEYSFLGIPNGCLNVSVTATESYTDKLIDIWRAGCVTLQPGEKYIYNQQLGLFKNMEGSFEFWLDCPGYAGPNCAKECSPNSKSFCNEEGNLECRDGFVGAPDCRLQSPCRQSNPCRNGAACKALSTTNYECDCPVTHTGKNCDILACDPNSCAGYCQNGDCVCNSTNIDESCTSYSCDDNFLCKNNGTCAKLGDNIFCACPLHTSGFYCQYFCDPPCVFGKCTSDSKGKSVCECKNGYGGPTCDIELGNLDTDNTNSKNSSNLGPLNIAAIFFATFFGIGCAALLAHLLYNYYQKIPFLNTFRKHEDSVIEQNEVL